MSTVPAHHEVSTFVVKRHSVRSINVRFPCHRVSLDSMRVQTWMPRIVDETLYTLEDCSLNLDWLTG